MKLMLKNASGDAEKLSEILSVKPTLVNLL